MHWGHTRTKDFLNWEELPVALTLGDKYDDGGCWSGTAISGLSAIIYPLATVYLIKIYPKHKKIAHLFLKEYVFKRFK